LKAASDKVTEDFFNFHATFLLFVRLTGNDLNEFSAFCYCIAYTISAIFNGIFSMNFIPRFQG
jgi:hypothetical protein